MGLETLTLTNNIFKEGAFQKATIILLWDKSLVAPDLLRKGQAFVIIFCNGEIAPVICCDQCMGVICGFCTRWGIQ